MRKAEERACASPFCSAPSSPETDRTGDTQAAAAIARSHLSPTSSPWGGVQPPTQQTRTAGDGQELGPARGPPQPALDAGGTDRQDAVPALPAGT